MAGASFYRPGQGEDKAEVVRCLQTVVDLRFFFFPLKMFYLGSLAGFKERVGV